MDRSIIKQIILKGVQTLFRKRKIVDKKFKKSKIGCYFET